MTVVEGMTDFPLADVDLGQLVPSPTSSRCSWKGRTTSFHVFADDDVAQDAAFRCEHAWPLARRLVGDRIACWQGVEVTRDRSVRRCESVSRLG